MITGASSGIGTAIATAFASHEACHLILVGRRHDALTEISERCRKLGATTRTVVCDVSSATDRERLVRSVTATEQRCDVLVNNAGIGARITRLDADNIARAREVIATNLTAPMELTLGLLPLLRQAAPSASVVDIASVAGFTPLPMSAIYCASKFGLHGWSRSISTALRREGIHVACVFPGPVPTPGFPHAGLMARPMLRRLLTASPQSVANHVVRCADGRSVGRTIPRVYVALRVLALLAARPIRWLAPRPIGR